VQEAQELLNSTLANVAGAVNTIQQIPNKITETSNTIATKVETQVADISDDVAARKEQLEESTFGKVDDFLNLAIYAAAAVFSLMIGYIIVRFAWHCAKRRQYKLTKQAATVDGVPHL
jgi:preprotein translocase subunit SecF